VSVAAYARAVRDHLRSNLSNFYDKGAEKRGNCKVMLNERPAANCGQEFISIYGSTLQARDKYLMQAVEEVVGITVAVSRKISFVPPDYRGELGYLNLHEIPLTEDPGEHTEFDRFYEAWVSVEQRCREIVRLLVGRDRYTVMQEANALLEGSPFTEPLLWQGTDAVPREVGPEHFWGYQEPQKDSDNVFGLLSKVYFGDAIRMQPISDLDTDE
jgi:hypothetical protein